MRRDELSAEEQQLLEFLEECRRLEERGLLTSEVNDEGELRFTPTPAGVAAVREEEEVRNGR